MGKILMPQLISMLAARTGSSKKAAESFLKTYFNIIGETLEDHETVKIKELGTFKIIRVEERKSVNVSTGEDLKIPPHFKIGFTPGKEMAEKVNREFSWLDNVELSENINNKELEGAETSAISREQEEQSERLGEELEEDFGVIQPVEPLGPLDPQDPEPGTPEPANQNRQAQPVAVPRNKPGEFDPYAMEKALVDKERERLREPIYITRDELENLATKNDFRVIVRNLKKIKSSVDEQVEINKDRSRKTILWSLICCLILMTGGFILTYYLLSYRFMHTVSADPEDLETNIVAETDDEEYAPASISGLQADEEVADNSVSNVQAAPTKEEVAAPTSPSDILAMDKVTNTRYLTTMAKEHYGNYNFWPYIYLENEGKLGHPDRIKPGTTVVIPNIEKYNINPTNPQDIEKAKKLSVEIYKKYANN